MFCSNPKFHKFKSLITSKDHAISKFFKSKTIKEVCNVKKKNHINKTTHNELTLFRQVLQNADKFKCEISIRHLIDSDYECTVIRDACLTSGGIFCDNLKFWHYIPCPQHVIDRTLKNKEMNHLETVFTI